MRYDVRETMKDQAVKQVRNCGPANHGFSRTSLASGPFATGCPAVPLEVAAICPPKPATTRQMVRRLKYC